MLALTMLVTKLEIGKIITFIAKKAKTLCTRNNKDVHLIRVITLFFSLKLQCLSKALRNPSPLVLPARTSTLLSDSSHATSPSSLTVPQSHCRSFCFLNVPSPGPTFCSWIFFLDLCTADSLLPFRTQSTYYNTREAYSDHLC